MTEAKLASRVVRIKVERGETGLFYATSPDLEGLLVAEPNEAALNQMIPGAIEDLYAACGETVVVLPAQAFSDDVDTLSFVKVPADIAQAALDRISHET